MFASDRFDGLGDFDPNAGRLRVERERTQALEAALRQMQIALRSTPRKAVKRDLEKARQLALDVVDSVLVEVG